MGTTAMGVISTRPTQQHHQARATLAASLVVFLLLAQTGFASTSKNLVAAQADNSPGQQPASIALTSVAAGEEAIELSGRFTNNSTNYAQGVDWKIKTLDGSTLFSGSAESASMKLRPGSYEVQGKFGNVAIDETVTLPPAQSIAINFVLNAGFLRILPHLNNPSSALPASQTQIYTASGPSKGTLAATSHKPGEMIKLAAGTYHLETAFENSNIATVTEVEVKPGIIRAIEINEHAGLVHLQSALRAQNWKITSDTMPTETAARLTSTNADVVLKPGHYTATSTNHTATRFTVQDGEEIIVSLGE